MLITCRSHRAHIYESPSTLRFGERAAKIQNEMRKKDEIGDLKTLCARTESLLESAWRSMSQKELADSKRMWSIKMEMLRPEVLETKYGTSLTSMMNRVVDTKNKSRAEILEAQIKRRKENREFHKNKLESRYAVLDRKFKSIAEKYPRSRLLEFAKMQTLQRRFIEQTERLQKMTQN